MNTPEANRTDAGSRGDFLSSVIDRAQERAPVVQPRVASLFEPFVASPAVMAADAAEPRGPAPAVAPSPAAAIAGLLPSLRQSPMPMSMPPAERAPLPGMSAPLAAAPPITVAAAAAVPFAVAPPDAGLPPLAPLQHPQPASTGLARPSLPTVAARAAPPLGPVPSAGSLVAEVRDADESAKYGTASASVAEAPLPPRLPALLADRALVAAFAPPSHAFAAPRESAVAASAAPVVTISIGRVDVRAPAAAPPAARAPATPRPVALSDYLGRKERAR